MIIINVLQIHLFATLTTNVFNTKHYVDKNLYTHTILEVLNATNYTTV